MIFMRFTCISYNNSIFMISNVDLYTVNEDNDTDPNIKGFCIGKFDDFKKNENPTI